LCVTFDQSLAFVDCCTSRTSSSGFCAGLPFNRHAPLFLLAYFTQAKVVFVGTQASRDDDDDGALQPSPWAAIPRGAPAKVSATKRARRPASGFGKANVDDDEDSQPEHDDDDNDDNKDGSWPATRHLSSRVASGHEAVPRASASVASTSRTATRRKAPTPAPTATRTATPKVAAPMSPNDVFDESHLLPHERSTWKGYRAPVGAIKLCPPDKSYVPQDECDWELESDDHWNCAHGISSRLLLSVEDEASLLRPRWNTWVWVCAFGIPGNGARVARECLGAALKPWSVLAWK